MENNILNGYIGFKGEQGLSAYDIAVANGFEGTEQDWLANLGTSSIFDQYKSIVTTTGETTIIDAPKEYTNTAFIEIFENGLRLNKNQYSITTSEGDGKYQISFTPAIASGKTLEIVTTQMTTNNLPIVDTIDENSTNDTSPGTKAVYDKLKNISDSISTMQTIIDTIYPVGSLYMSVNNLDPTTLFGGKWERFAKGKAVVGVDEDDTDFSISEKIYGEKSHKLVVNEMPSHTHSMANGGSHKHDIRYRAIGRQDGGYWTPVGAVEVSTTTTAFTTSSGEHKHTLNAAGGGLAHNNVQPSIACYIWKRVE